MIRARCPPPFEFPPRGQLKPDRDKMTKSIPPNMTELLNAFKFDRILRQGEPTLGVTHHLWFGVMAKVRG